MLYLTIVTLLMLEQVVQGYPGATYSIGAPRWSGGMGTRARWAEMLLTLKVEAVDQG